MDTLTFQSYQQHLIKQLQTKQSLLPQVAEAFLRVPRHPFVSHYYEHQSGSRAWTRYEQSETIAWYEHVYQDQALITQVDEQRRILSSSSQPTIMACMLNALKVEPGMRVLEIGTGTGYNAGLLAALTEDPHLVTTIDIDGSAVEHARTVLTDVVGEGLTVVQGDGSKGFSEHAPYDRIIATASTPTLPLSWAEQLAPDGLLVCILQPRYTALGGLLVAKKHSDELLKGALTQLATFMALRNDHPAERKIPIDLYAPSLVTFSYNSVLFEPSLLQTDHHFAFFFYSALPDIRLIRRPPRDEDIYYREAFPQGYLALQSHPSSRVELRGDRPSAHQLWNCFTSIYSSWLHYEQPRITQYEWEMNLKSGYQTLFLTTPHGLLWPFNRHW